MENNNYDFGGHIQDDTDVSPPQLTEAQEKRLSPYGLLVAHIGHSRARELFDKMQHLAARVAEERGGGVPAITFDVDGGRFVTIKERGSDE